jgi:hypothetical protein
MTARSLVTSPYPRASGLALGAFARLRVRAWDRALRRLKDLQEATLLALVRRARDTEYGRVHDFAGIRDHRSFVHRVSIGDYDGFSPRIERMRRGEANVLVPEAVRHYGNSSGSSNQGRSKFLPIGPRQIRLQQRAGTDTVMRYLHHSGDRDLFSGFTLGLFPPTTMKPEGPSLVTSNPALMATQMPRIARPVYLPEDDLRAVADYDEKLSLIAERYLDHDVRAAAGTTCWFSLLFEKVLAVAKRRGRSAGTIAEVWPNLRVLFGGGVAAAPYLPVIRALVGRDDVTLVDTYNATEGGIYASSDFSGAPGMLVLPHGGVFFEFVPLDARGQPSPPRLPLWEVERDRLYSIVVTTASGLYAYELGDIVRFTSIAPPRLEFAGRLSGCLSITQELTTHVEIERAVARAIQRCRCTTVDFGAAADVGVSGSAKSRYALFVEFQEHGEPSDLGAFARAFDDGLCEENRVYREHRRGDVALLPPLVVPLATGGARRFLEAVTRGNVQGKFPRIVDDAQKQLLWRHAARRRPRGQPIE